MSEVRVGPNESIDHALRRFRKSVRRSGVLKDMRRKEFYDKPSVRRKKKAEAARKKQRRRGR